MTYLHKISVRIFQKPDKKDASTIKQESPKFERISARNAFEHPDHLARYLWIIGSVKGKRVLDCGCGEGYGMSLLKTQTVDVVGLDVSRDAAKAVKSNDFTRECDFVLGDIFFMPFTKEIFDVVTSFEVIEHLDNGEAYIANICETLKPNGVFIGSTPIKKPRRYRNGRPKNPFHKREYYPEEIRNLLEKHFRQVKLFGQKFPSKLGRIALSLMFKLRILRSHHWFYSIHNKVTPKDEKCLWIAKIVKN